MVCVRALSCFLLDDPGVIIHPFIQCVHCKEYHSKESFSSHVHEQNNTIFLRPFGANEVKRNDLQYNVNCKTIMFVSKLLSILRVIIWKIVNSEKKKLLCSLNYGAPHLDIVAIKKKKWPVVVLSCLCKKTLPFSQIKYNINVTFFHFVCVCVCVWAGLWTSQVKLV